MCTIIKQNPGHGGKNMMLSSKQTFLDPLSPKSDQYQFSPNNVKT